MNIKRPLILLSALAVIASATFGANAPARAADTTTLTIAMIGGSADSQDKANYNAALLAAEKINADGLSDSNDNKYTLAVQYYEANTSDKLKEKFTDAKSDKVAAILAPADSDRLNTILTKDVGSFAVLSASPDTPDKTNVFRLTASPTASANAAADFLVAKRHLSKIAVVAADTETAQTQIKNFKTKAGDKNILATYTHAADSTSFNETARAIRDSKADAIFAWTLDTPMAALLNALNTVGWKGTVVYQGMNAEFVKKVGAEKAQNVFGPLGWTASAYDTTSQDFVTSYANSYGMQPPDRSAAYYDAVEMIAAVVAKGNKDTASISSGLASLTNYQGIQARYDNGKANSLLIVQSRNSENLIEAARYANGSCTNCADTTYTNITDTKVTTRSTLTVAVIGNFTGPSQATGEAALHGAQLAVREVNDKGGIIGPSNTRYTLVLTTYDAPTAKDASDAVKKAKDAGAAIILGPDYNGQILPALTQASTQSIAQLVSATSSDITTNETSDYVFGLRATDAQLGKATLQYLLDERDLTRFATFAVRTDYGLNTINALKDQIAASDDGRVVASVDHNLDQTDYAQYAKDLTATNPEVILAWTTQPALEGLIDALGKTDWKGTLVYGYLTSDLTSTLKVPANIELLGPVNWWNNAADWASVDFSNRYTGYYGTAPLQQSAVYYDAIHLIAHGVKEVGGKNTDLRSWINKQTAFRGVQGMYKPSSYADGELARTVLILRVGSAGVTEVARYDDGACWVNCSK